MKKFIAGVVAATLMISGCAFAAEESAEAKKEFKAPFSLSEEQREILTSKIKISLEEMLKEETITQEQYEALVSFADKAGSVHNNFKGFDRGQGMQQRLELTEEQKAKMIEERKTKLSERLAAGEITQEQYDEQIARIESGEFAPVGGRGQGMPKKASDETETTTEETSSKPGRAEGFKQGRLFGGKMGTRKVK